MTEVYLDGIRLIPGINYTVGVNQISFSTPPLRGSSIEIVTLGRSVAVLKGDGNTFLFSMNLPTQFDKETVELIQDAYQYRNVPAVREMLDQLRVIIALVKDVPNTQVVS